MCLFCLFFSLPASSSVVWLPRGCRLPEAFLWGEELSTEWEIIVVDYWGSTRLGTPDQQWELLRWITPETWLNYRKSKSSLCPLDVSLLACMAVFWCFIVNDSLFHQCSETEGWYIFKWCKKQQKWIIYQKRLKGIFFYCSWIPNFVEGTKE